MTPYEKAIAFGGVATGNTNASEADTVAGIIRYRGLIFTLTACKKRGPGYCWKFVLVHVRVCVCVCVSGPKLLPGSCSTPLLGQGVPRRRRRCVCVCACVCMYTCVCVIDRLNK